VQLSGIGLHGGRAVTMTLRPGRPDSGIVFVRNDAPRAARMIRATWRAVASSRLATVLGNHHGLAASTVEHLMSALRACEVDNAVVALEGDEVPIEDGSALPFLRLIRRAGLASLPAPRRYIRVLAPIEVRAGNSCASLKPCAGERFTVTIEFPSRAIGRQKVDFDLQRDSYEEAIAPARTFGFADQLDALRRQGLARGGSQDNAVVVDGDRVLNPEGLRFPDEFARHKLLDSIGDLYLAGAPLLARYQAFRPGHALNVALLSALFASRDNWESVTDAPITTTHRDGRERTGT
jgi:UDP-3-O-[3-hydroxymyristoyl] N-acetylglucosamine deacetylase